MTASEMAFSVNQFRHDAKLAHGYHMSATISQTEFESQVRSRSNSEEQVVDEAFSIEIDAWNRLLTSLRDCAGSLTT